MWWVAAGDGAGPGAPEHATDSLWETYGSAWVYQGRSPRARDWILAGYLVAVLVVFMAVTCGLTEWFLVGVDPEDYASAVAYQAAYDEAWYASDPYIAATLAGIFLPLFALLAPRAGYRWFDTFLLLIPGFGLVFLGRVLWRWTDIRNWRGHGEGVGPPPSRTGVAAYL